MNKTIPFLDFVRFMFLGWTELDHDTDCDFDKDIEVIWCWFVTLWLWLESISVN